MGRDLVGTQWGVDELAAQLARKGIRRDRISKKGIKSENRVVGPLNGGRERTGEN